MKIAVLGGTGDLGYGLAMRLARIGEKVIIGSRSSERAVKAAREAEKEAGVGSIRGLPNLEAAREAEWIILSVPYNGFRPILEEIRGTVGGKIMIDVMNPIDPKRPRAAKVPPEGSATEQVQGIVGEETAVVGAFKHLSAEEARHLELPPPGDVMICGDDSAAKERVADLVRRLGMHPLDAGAKENARVVEGLTALLIGFNRDHRVKGSGIHITGLERRKKSSRNG